MKGIGFITVWVSFVFLASFESWAATPAASPSPTATSKASKKDQKSAGKKKSREASKETDGSVALDRFEADTVIKSQYTLDGKPLEVDPD
ncbi:hypothetical protein EBZ37_03155 [bacterium]|nr:hypothetical protein [bacterium]